MRDIVLIAHNLRSCHNVGSLLRTAEGLGVTKVILSGYTPHPLHANDRRLPHEAQKLARQIHKTALGAKYHPPEKIAIVLGREVEGVEPDVLEACDTALEIPMFGKKESFNVVQAAAMALYHCKFSL
jgi:23S rRNA (guanosine2251-2'-O)-methyltransferase